MRRVKVKQESLVLDRDIVCKKNAFSFCVVWRLLFQTVSDSVNGAERKFSFQLHCYFYFNFFFAPITFLLLLSTFISSFSLGDLSFFPFISPDIFIICFYSLVIPLYLRFPTRFRTQFLKFFSKIIFNMLLLASSVSINLCMQQNL